MRAVFPGECGLFSPGSAGCFPQGRRAVFPGECGLFSLGKVSSHSTALPSLSFYPVCTVSSCFHTTVCDAYSFTTYGCGIFNMRTLLGVCRTHEGASGINKSTQKLIWGGGVGEMTATLKTLTSASGCLPFSDRSALWLLGDDESTGQPRVLHHLVPQELHTRHTSPLTHTSPVTPHCTHVTPHRSHVTGHTSPVTRHRSHLTAHTSHLTSLVIRHTFLVTSHM